MLCSHPACCTILIEHCELLWRAHNWNHEVYYSCGQNNDDVWLMSDSWVASFPGPAHLSVTSSTVKQWKTGWGLGTRLTPEYNYKKDTTDQSLPTLASTTGSNINIIHTGFMGGYKLIMFKMTWSQAQSWVSKTLRNWQSWWCRKRNVRGKPQLQ